MFGAIPIPLYNHGAPSLGVSEVFVTNISLPMFEQKIGFAIRTIVKNSSCHVCGGSYHAYVRADSMISDIFCMECSAFIETIIAGTEEDKYPWAEDATDYHR